MDIIITKDLVKKYKDGFTSAVDHLNLNINKGTFYGLLGPNGAGKTTLISILCGLVKPTSGEITINGRNGLTEFNQIKGTLGLVPQEIALYPTLTLRENCEYFSSLYPMKKKERKARINEIMEKTGLTEFQKRRIDRFSGGMKRRANLAVSLLHKPDILFLDEPTANVDPQSREVIYDLLNEYRNNGTTFIYTTHQIQEAQALCDKVAIMDCGKIIIEDTPAQLIASHPNANNLGEVFMELTGRDLRDD